MTTVKKRDVGKDLQFPRSKRRAGGIWQWQSIPDLGNVLLPACHVINLLQLSCNRRLQSRRMHEIAD